ncbi:MAG: hypothetical protein HKN20_15460 [Gemmatimonadetes bacterium]|nr:hypothetical protein [Gemmatimonadota bacterium]
MATIALVTYRELPDWQEDEQLLAEELESRGHEVHATIWDDAEVEWRACDLVIIRSTWDYDARADEFLQWCERVARAAPLWNELAIIRWNTHKKYLRELASHGVPIVTSHYAARGSTLDLARFLEERGWDRAVLKRAVGAGARDSLRIRGAEDHADAQRVYDKLAREGDVIVQPFLETIATEGEISIICIDGEPSHALRKIPKPGDWRSQEEFDAHHTPHEITPAERRLCAKILGNVDGDLLYARVDLVMEDGEARLIELELIEPALYLQYGDGAVERFADAIEQKLD